MADDLGDRCLDALDDAACMDVGKGCFEFGVDGARPPNLYGFEQDLVEHPA